MRRAAATLSGRDAHVTVRGVLSGVLLAAAVIFGLLGMHALNLHGMAAADSPAAASAITVTVAQPTAHHVAADTTHSGGSSADGALHCAGCSTDDHSGMAALCVLALLLALLVIVPPRLLHGSNPKPARASLSEALGLQPLRRTPSLLVLCISRT